VPTPIRRDATRELASRAETQLVEALPKPEYAWAHLPGAVNIPIRDLDAATARQLDLRAPIVVYCHDTACDVSSRAAWRFEQLGATDVYDYLDSKMDWIGAGLQWEGTAELVSGCFDARVATCRADERVDKVAARVGQVDVCVAIVGPGVVNGVLRRAQLENADSARVADVMELGPATVRPSEERESLDARLAHAERREILVTTPEGRLLGVYRRAAG
jgi:rhodanese-related sulfurtransferase